MTTPLFLQIKKSFEFTVPEIPNRVFCHDGNLWYCDDSSGFIKGSKVKISFQKGRKKGSPHLSIKQVRALCMAQNDWWIETNANWSVDQKVFFKTFDLLSDVYLEISSLQTKLENRVCFAESLSKDFTSLFEKIQNQMDHVVGELG